MATFFGRRYVRPVEAVGNTEKLLGVFILLLVAAVVVAFVVQVARNRDYLFEIDEQAYTPTPPAEAGPEVETAGSPAIDVENPFPGTGLEGWSSPARVDRFTADNLYVKIDGRADAYVKFDVAGLTFGRYSCESDPDRTVDVYWYDMGAPANAVGMYESEEPRGATPVSIGDAGYQVGGAVFFCKGSSYVQVLPARIDETDAQTALKIAERLAERIGQE